MHLLYIFLKEIIKTIRSIGLLSQLNYYGESDFLIIMSSYLRFRSDTIDDKSFGMGCLAGFSELIDKSKIIHRNDLISK